MGTQVLVSIFTIQLVVSIFGAHFLLGTPEIATHPVLTDPTWWDIVRGILGSPMDLWDLIQQRSPLAKFTGAMMEFSWKMITFDVPGMPEVFSYIWLVMTLAVIIILVDKIRGLT